MTTRLYLIPDSTPQISPAFDAGWNQTTSAVRRSLATYSEDVPPATASQTVAISENTATSPFDVALVQLISGPLSGAQTVGGGGATLKGQLKASEANADADYRAQVIARVLSGDGTTVRGTILAADASALTSEFATSLTNRKFPLGSPATLSSVSASDGDRIVVEVGYRSHNSHTTARNGTIEIRQGAAADLAEDETDTGTDNPWFEFSQDLTFVTSVDLTTEVMEAAGSVTGRTTQMTTLVMEVAFTSPTSLGYWGVLIADGT